MSDQYILVVYSFLLMRFNMVMVGGWFISRCSEGANCLVVKYIYLLYITGKMTYREFLTYVCTENNAAKLFIFILFFILLLFYVLNDDDEISCKEPL